MAEVDTKLLLKVQDDFEQKWVHLCYVDTPIYKKFTELFDDKEPLNRLLSLWCKQDFHVDLDIDTLENLKELKNLIKEHYKNEYPYIYRDNTVDAQGWIRTWVTKKMREAIENGKVSE